jgi:hypothetical protein
MCCLYFFYLLYVITSLKTFLVERESCSWNKPILRNRKDSGWEPVFDKLISPESSPRREYSSLDHPRARIQAEGHGILKPVLNVCPALPYLSLGDSNKDPVSPYRCSCAFGLVFCGSAPCTMPPVSRTCEQNKLFLYLPCSHA